MTLAMQSTPEVTEFHNSKAEQYLIMSRKAVLVELTVWGDFRYSI